MVIVFPFISPYFFLVNGCFELNSNRRDLWSGDDLEGQDQNKALWNRYLLEEVVAVACVDLLERIVQKSANVENFYTLWPDCDHLSDSWKHLGSCVYRLAAKRKLLYSQANGGKWIYASEAVYVPHHSTIDDEIISFLLEKGSIIYRGNMLINLQRFLSWKYLHMYINRLKLPRIL